MISLFLIPRTINLRTGHVYCYIHVYTHMQNASCNPRAAHVSKVFPRQKDLFLQTYRFMLWLLLLLLFFSVDKDVPILEHIFLYIQVKSYPGKVVKVTSNGQEVTIWLKNQVWQIQHYVCEQEKRPQRPFHQKYFLWNNCAAGAPCSWWDWQVSSELPLVNPETSSCSLPLRHPQPRPGFITNWYFPLV